MLQKTDFRIIVNPHADRSVERRMKIPINKHPTNTFALLITNLEFLFMAFSS